MGPTLGTFETPQGAAAESNGYGEGDPGGVRDGAALIADLEQLLLVLQAASSRCPASARLRGLSRALRYACVAAVL